MSRANKAQAHSMRFHHGKHLLDVKCLITASFRNVGQIYGFSLAKALVSCAIRLYDQATNLHLCKGFNLIKG